MRMINKMKLTHKIKQLFCKHDYAIFANIHGDLVNYFNARTVLLCKKCSKRKFIRYYIKAPVNYNNFLKDCDAYRKTGNLILSPQTLEDANQYAEEFAPKEIGDIRKIVR